MVSPSVMLFQQLQPRRSPASPLHGLPTAASWFLTLEAGYRYKVLGYAPQQGIGRKDLNTAWLDALKGPL